MKMIFVFGCTSQLNKIQYYLFYFGYMVADILSAQLKLMISFVYKWLRQLSVLSFPLTTD